jgi:ferritin
VSRRTRIERAPMAEWCSIFEHHERNAQLPIMRRAETRAAEEATHAARLSAYLSAREAGASHAAAVKAQNRAARVVRKALGFAYPDSEVTF